MKKNHVKMLVLAVAMGLQGQALAAESAVVDSESYRQPGGIMYFFEYGMPDTVTASDDSLLAIESTLQKDGQHSLAWQFSPGNTLTFTQPIGYKPFVANNTDQSQSTFTTWIYNASPLAGTLRFSFLAQGQQASWFDINMDFVGWRQLLVPFSDMQGQPSKQMDQLIIETSQAGGSGKIYLDQLMTSIPVDPRWPTRDAVVPYVNVAADVAPNRHWLALYRYSQFLQQHTHSVLDGDVSRSVSVGSEVEVIEKTLDEFILANDKSLSNKQLQALKVRYDSYQLAEHNGVITGLPLDNSNRLKTFLDKGVNKGLLNQEGFDTVFGIKLLREYGEYMLELAQALQGDLVDEDRRTIEAMYLKLTHYAITQGYTAGSGLGTAHHMGYTLRALFQAHYLSRDLLAREGLAQQVSDMMAWYSGTGRIYRPVEEMTNFNVDIMNTQLRGMLYSVLMQPDPQQREAWLSQFSFWLSQSITRSDGLGGGFKTDGSVFHHAQHYPAYAKGALKGLTPVIEALSGTSFSVTPQAHQTVKHAVAMTEIYSNDQLTLMSVTGRHPDGEQSIELVPFKHMALAGSPDGTQAIDLDMAAAYLRMAGKDDAFGRYLVQQGMESGVAPQGNWVMNLASMTIQRRSDWVAAVRGFSRYLVSHESYANANRYGRYINYGQLEIMGPESEARAFSHDGWNWNRWPGTTAVQLPYEALNAKLRNVDTFSGLEEMLLSEQSFAGGVGNGENGLYAMVLQGHPKYDASFQAHKSVFFFDNRIVALGSGITTEQTAYPTQTTLFQHAVYDDGERATVNGLPFAASEQQVDVKPTRFLQLRDPDGNAYFVSAAQDVRVSQGEQVSVHQKNSSTTQGIFATAVIDHGKAPLDGHYEYAVLVKPEQEQLDTFARQLSSAEHAPYQIVQQDERAHVVSDSESQTTGYAVFAADTEFDSGLVAQVGAPAMVMVMVATQGSQLQLSLVNPDLNLYQGRDGTQYDAEGTLQEVSIYSRKWKDNPFKAVDNRMVLRGQWMAASALPAGVTLHDMTNGHTEIRFSTVGAEPLQVLLTQQ
ncbi:chondroitinase family polysaccharide lyase [Photobacterium lutimaris]|nr:chondroitinase family polysaccharide lyase [Photobacterium lutimaris]TDR74434.1 chondroitin-sulfate-ABC endolyase/exolyase [Photobacterium lutimaris]